MSKTKNKIDFLKKVPLFNGLTDRQLKMMVNSMTSRSYADGDAMVTQGEIGLGMFIIISGQAEAIRETEAGDRVSVNSFQETDFFGELGLLDEGPRTATVIARSDVESMILTRWDFLALLREDAGMAVTVLQELARRFRFTLDKMSTVS